MIHSSHLLLSPYHGDSHRQLLGFINTLLNDPRSTALTLPGRNFRWRIRGNSLSWLSTLKAHRAQHLWATSMTDLASLVATQRWMHDCSKTLYFHENQFAYPRSQSQHASIDPQMVQLYSALCADRLWFNSAYNRDSFCEGVDALMAKMPDHRPEALAPQLQQKSVILPVPITPITAKNKDPLLIVWPHRWEYDKAPMMFLRALDYCKTHRQNFRLALLGARAQNCEALNAIRAQFSSHILVDDYVQRDQYEYWLSRAGIVLSTAIHEFQGLAMLEAISAGAQPIAPNALCYPEYLPRTALYDDQQQLNHALVAALSQPPQPSISVEHYLASTLTPRWQQALSNAINGN